MKKNVYLLGIAILAVAITQPSYSAPVLYGITTTTMEEGNGRIVSLDVASLSTDRENPTCFTEISTLENGNDFMAGTSVGNMYYCYYNTFDQASGISMQHFGTLDFMSGAFTTIAETEHAGSDDVTDMMDMVCDSGGGGLLGLDRQYIPSQEKFIGTIQYISMRTGKLKEIFVFDRRYVAICSDGIDGYYLAALDRDDQQIYRPSFYHADKRFNITPILSNATQLEGESSFAHSMAMDGNILYLITGSVVTCLDLDKNEAESFYLEKELYGVTFIPGGTSGIDNPITDSAVLDGNVCYDLNGNRIDQPKRGTVYIRFSGGRAEKFVM